MKLHEHVRTESGPKRKEGGPDRDHPLTMVAGARYAQRCPAEFGVPMEAVVAAYRNCEV